MPQIGDGAKVAGRLVLLDVEQLRGPGFVGLGLMDGEVQLNFGRIYQGNVVHRDLDKLAATKEAVFGG